MSADYATMKREKAQKEISSESVVEEAEEHDNPSDPNASKGSDKFLAKGGVKSLDATSAPQARRVYKTTFPEGVGVSEKKGSDIKFAKEIGDIVDDNMPDWLEYHEIGYNKDRTFFEHSKLEAMDRAVSLWPKNRILSPALQAIANVKQGLSRVLSEESRDALKGDLEGEISVTLTVVMDALTDAAETLS
jgi:hypothetical protein